MDDAYPGLEEQGSPASEWRPAMMWKSQPD